jgi:hypothetical protein
MQARLEALTQTNQDLARRLAEANAGGIENHGNRKV